ncbi:Zinc finger MYM-type protein 1 [Frankliniella fusca]|uniref:Zinc finger MYM-type protein 1 n=1 Tax=Frankliniella fusca TaxID=407009 RepID=A0AAE1I2P6_9NEOP|nr:Zinc finger MYM-type protein 1 [Frankliniella fusca]
MSNVGRKRDWAKYNKDKYNPEWEKEAALKKWLRRTPDELINQGKGAAYCSLCKSTLRAQHSDLISHGKSAKHRGNEKALPSATQPVLQQFGYETLSGKKTKEKETDIKLSVLTACHSSIRSVDHLTDMIRTVGSKETELKEIRLHRTKCSKIVERVVVPCLLEDVIADIGDFFYSLIIDESTDVSTVRQLALCIKYYSRKYKKFVVEFLGLVETPIATADKLYEVVTLFLTTVGLKLSRLLGLGTDGGANLCGCNHSLYTILKLKDCPWLMLVKCTCHSLDKAASYASKELPENLEFLLRESKNHFKNSHRRREAYERLHEEMNGCKPPLLVKVAATRWLSYHGAVKTHLSQYNALQAYFKDLVRQERPDKICPILKRISDLHDDARSILMLTFLKPVLEKVTITNVLFQRSNADLTKAFSDLRVFVFSMARRVLKENALFESAQPGVLRRSESDALRAALHDKEKLRPLDRVDFGEAFKNLAKTLLDAGQITPEALQEVRISCANYLTRLSKELAQRLPDTIQDMESISCNLLFLRYFLSVAHGYDLDTLKDQWLELAEVSFMDIYPSGDHTTETIPTDVFWCHVLELRNARGDRPFKDIAFCVLTLMTLPLSNAFVERVFSVMSIVKSKLRNKVSTKMLSAILFLRLHLQAHGKCCTTMDVTEGMLRRFNSRTMYAYPNQGNRRPREPAAAPAGGGGRAAEEDVDDPEAVGPVAAGGIPGAGDGVPAAFTFENDDNAIDAVLDFLEGDEDMNRLFALF